MPIIMFSSAPQTISSTGLVTITGLTAAVNAGTYVFYGNIGGVMGGTSSPIVLAPSTPTSTFFEWSIMNTARGGGATGIQFNSTTNTSITSPSITNGVSFNCWITGLATFSAAGTFAWQAAEGTNLDTWTVNYGWFLFQQVGT